MSDLDGIITTTLNDITTRGKLMTKTLRTRTRTLAYTLAGFAAFACLLALVIWTITPTEQDSNGIAPQSPIDTTTFWIILAGAAALTLLVTLPIATLLVPKLMHRSNHTNDTQQKLRTGTGTEMKIHNADTGTAPPNPPAQPISDQFGWALTPSATPLGRPIASTTNNSNTIDT